jgi:hypothetical protein
MIAEVATPRRLRLASRALLAYGVVGVLASLVALTALVVGLGRLGALADGLSTDVDSVSALLGRTGDALEQASNTADSVGVTIDSSVGALTTAAADLRGIEPRLRDIEARANAINILGSQPLAPLAGLFGEIAGQLGDLDAQLDSIASGLGTNQAALAASGESLRDLAARTRLLGTRLGGDRVAGVVDDLRWLLASVLAIGAIGAAVPASGALVTGLWLRRRLRD